MTQQRAPAGDSCSGGRSRLLKTPGRRRRGRSPSDFHSYPTALPAGRVIDFACKINSLQLRTTSGWPKLFFSKKWRRHFFDTLERPPETSAPAGVPLRGGKFRAAALPSLAITSVARMCQKRAEIPSADNICFLRPTPRSGRAIAGRACIMAASFDPEATLPHFPLIAGHPIQRHMFCFWKIFPYAGPIRYRKPASPDPRFFRSET